MTRKEKKITLLYSIGLVIALMLLPFAAELTRADTQIQLIEFKYEFGSSVDSVKLDLLGHNTLQVEDDGKRSHTVIWLGIAAVALIAVIVSDSDGNSAPAPALKCHFVIVGGESTQVCN